jgi:IclR family acetate operon transcriptional repressor
MGHAGAGSNRSARLLKARRGFSMSDDPKTAGRRAAPGQVQSLTRALEVLRVIAAAPDGLILRDVARAAGLPVSTAHRLLTTLEGERFVRANPDTAVWTIGAEAFAVGQGFVRARDVAALARPRLRALTSRWGETASLYLEADGGLICAAQVESRQMVRAVTRVGGLVSMHCTAAGKAWLAATQEPDLSGLRYDRRTPRTLTTEAGLRAAVDVTRAQGWALDDEELVEGVRCVAAAVLDEEGRPLAALSVSGPVSRVTPAAAAALGAAVASAAADLSRDCGWMSDRH